MANANTVILIGNLTSDPQMKNTQSGTNVTTTGVAVTRKYKGQEEVSFFDIVAFGKTAETLNQYGRKGLNVYIQGRLKQDRWEDRQTGQKRSKVTIVVDQMQMLNKPPEGSYRPAQSQPDHGQQSGGYAPEDTPF